MKKLMLIATVIFLASCGTTTIEEKPTTDSTTTAICPVVDDSCKAVCDSTKKVEVKTATLEPVK